MQDTDYIEDALHHLDAALNSLNQTNWSTGLEADSLQAQFKEIRKRLDALAANGRQKTFIRHYGI